MEQQGSVYDAVFQRIQNDILQTINTAREEVSSIARQDQQNETLKHKLREADSHVATLKVQIAGLTRENKSFRAQLIELLQSYHPDNAESLPQEPPSTMPYSDYEKLARKLDISRRKLLQASHDHKLEAEARQILVGKLRKFKTAALEWKEYAHKVEKTYKASSPGLLAQKPQLTPPNIHDIEDIMSSADKLLVSTAPSHLVDNGRPSSRDIHAEIPAISSPSKSSETAQRANELPSSQQETMELVSEADPMRGLEQADNVSNFVVDEDDVPLFVYERPVKRRRTGQRQSAGETDGLGLYAIKREPLSPVPMARTETFDLDEVGTTVQTPRRVRPVRRRPTNSDQEPLLRPERSLSEPIEVHESGPRFHHDALVQQTSTAVPIQNAHPKRNTKTTNTSDANAVPQRNPFTPISGNQRRLQGTTKKAQTTAGKQRKKRPSSNAFRIVLEDGEDEEAMMQPDLDRPDPLDRLNALMEGAPEQNSHRITRVSAQKSVPKFKVPPVPVREQANQEKKQPRPTYTRPAEPIRQPLRELPVHQLNLFDFKRNPATNHGLDYAFNDAFYGKERRCLPGCLDPRCCGEAMQALACTLRPLIPRPSIPTSKEDASLTDEEYTIKCFQRTEWNRKRYLALSKKDREELLLQAQTKYVAEQYGRHRNVSDRRNTPPGFWDADIPSTQEQEAQQKSAQELEKVLVTARHKEALKRGEWLFNDE